MKNDNSKNNMVAIIIAIAIVMGAGGFFGGMQYQKSQVRSAFAGQFGGAQGGPRGQGQGGAAARNGMRPVSGEILSADATSVTVKLPDGSSKIVLVTGNTQINKAAEATKADLVAGIKVAVYGTTNSDGSVTAQNIQLNPMIRGPMGGTPSATTTPR